MPAPRVSVRNSVRKPISPRELRALDGREHHLAQADRLGGDLDALVVADELERLIK